MSVRNHRRAMAGVISTRRHTFLRRPRRASSSTARAAVILAAAAVTLLAACSGGSNAGSPGVASVGSSSAAGSLPPSSAASNGPLAFSQCMRSHGILNFPDPTSSGQIPKGSAQEFGVSNSRYQTAQTACVHLIPPTGGTAEQQQETQCAMAGDCSQAVVQRWMSGLRTLAQCLRKHGEPNWPDPVIASLGGHPPGPHFPYEQAGIDDHSPQVLAKVQECIRLTGFEGLPLP